MRLALPREHQSVPVVRRILRHSLEAIMVDRDIAGDLELALTEACTNVLDHAGGTEEYEVIVAIDGEECVIEVIDNGIGYEGPEEPAEAHGDAEQGRGLLLMKAVADDVQVVKRPEVGTVVRIEKHLSLRGGLAMR
jgi:serine/threonine-protein kinase RsbW